MPPSMEVSQRLTRFLDRFSPPASIKDNPTAMQDEAEGLLKQLLRYAPREHVGPWCDRVLERCAEVMKTRAWPTVFEISAACNALRRDISAEGPDNGVEVSMVDRLEAWFRKFGNQMPGCGRPTRTAALIERGVLRNERFAKFKGFDLDHPQRERAKGQDASIEEQRHHDGVLFDLRATNDRIEANRAEARAMRGDA